MVSVIPTKRLALIWDRLRTSFWFVPIVMILAATALAIVMIAIDSRIDANRVDERLAWVFTISSEGSRAMLSSIATSMITVAGVIFSITIVTLSLASSQYSSRILRNFIRDRINQVVLGTFVAIFAYCVIVLRVVRSSDEVEFTPALSVLLAVILALVGIVMLVVYVHHVATTIQASNILKLATEETLAAIDELFPEEFGEPPPPPPSLPRVDADWQKVAAATLGYVQSVDGDALLEVAQERDVVVRMERGVGDFVVEGAGLASVWQKEPMDEDLAEEIGRAYAISWQRTIEQDPGFGIRQIVDMALRALSPGVNDTTTAVDSLHYLTAIVARLAGRKIESPYRLRDGRLRIIACGPTFESILDEAIGQIRQFGSSNVAVMTEMVRSLAVVGEFTRDAQRRSHLLHQLDRVVADARRGIESEHDRNAFLTLAAGVRGFLESLDQPS